ncbi:MAG: hypothetical protein ACK4N5_25220, partial [Myxococcales bacterium]
GAQHTLLQRAHVSPFAPLGLDVPPAETVVQGSQRWGALISEAARFAQWEGAITGVATAGLLYALAALLLVRRNRALIELDWGLAPDRAVYLLDLERVLTHGGSVAAGLLAAASFLQPGLLSSSLVLACGPLLYLAGEKRTGRIVVGGAALLVIHAAAHLGTVSPAWAGPAIATLGLLIVVLAPRVATWRGLDAGAVRVRAQLAAGLYGCAAATYALATGGSVDPSFAVPRLLWNALVGFAGAWLSHQALALTLALLAITVLAGARQWKGALAGLGAALGCGLGGLAAVCAASAAWYGRRVGGDYGRLFDAAGPILAMLLALDGLVAHLAVQLLARDDLRRGVRVARDGWLVASGLLLSLLVAFADGASAGPSALPAGVATL